MLIEGYKPISSEQTKVFKEVHSMSRTHMTWDGQAYLLKETRPNEDSGIYEYRKKNFRRLSRGGVNSWFAMFSRIFNHSGVKLTTIGEKLKDYLSEKPFRRGKKQMSLFQWFYSVAMWHCVEDPNGITLVYPTNTENKAKLANPNVKFFAWHQRKGTVQHDGQMWEYYAIQKDPDVKDMELDSGIHEHWLVNDKYVSLWEDQLINNKYVPVQKWIYPHNLGRVPTVGTVSFTTTLVDGNEVCESILGDYFEFCNEFLNRFSDAQGIALLHDHPIRVMLNLFLQLKCTNPKCTAGQSNLGFKGEAETYVPCSSCHDSGFDLGKLGTYGTLIFDENVGIDKVTGRDPITYAAPEPTTINNSFDKGFELYEMAKKAIGIDLVLAAGESGVAREMRLEQIQDKLGLWANICKMYLENVLSLMEGYLEINESQRTEPVIYVPQSFKLKNAEMLREDAINALPIDAYNAQMAFVEEKYQDDPLRVLSYRMSFDYVPSLLLSRDQMISAIASGLYDNYEQFKYDTIQPIIEKIIKGLPDPYEAKEETVITQAFDKVNAIYQATRPKEIAA